MNIETAFSPGDRAWCLVDHKLELLTVGMVRVEVVDTPGINGGVTRPDYPDLVFDNYKPATGRKEDYMMVETGIGAGWVYEMGKTVFATEHEAREAFAQREKEATT